MPEFDEFGIPIRSKSNTAVDEFGIPIKKKETTVSQSVQKQAPTSSGTQSKANQKPLGTSVSQKESKPEILFPAQKEKRNDVFTAEDGKTYRLDMSTGRPVWKGYTSSVVKGQGGSKQDYEIYNTIISNPNTVNTLNKTFGKQASTSDTDQIYTGIVGKEENQYRVYNNNWQRLTPNSNNWEEVNSEGAISYLNKNYGKNVKVPTTVKKEDKGYQFTDINSQLTSKTEEKVVPYLQRQYGKLGFTFEESGLGTDYVKVTSKNGNTIEVGLDENNPEEALKLKSFLQGNKSAIQTEESKKINDFIREANRFDLGSEYKKQATKELKDYRQSQEFVDDLKQMNFNEIESNINSIKNKLIIINDKEGLQDFYNSSAYKLYKEKQKEDSSAKAEKIDSLYYELKQAKTPEEKKQAKIKIDTYLSNKVINKQSDNYNIQLGDVSESYKKLNSAISQFDKDKADLDQRVNSGNISQEEYESLAESINKRAEYLDSRRQEIKSERDGLISDMNKLQSITGQYLIDKEKTGSFAGNMLNSFISGTSKIFEPSMQVLASVASNKIMMKLDPDELKMLKAKGYNDEEIKNYTVNKETKKLKEEFRSGLVEAFGTSETTKEYAQSKDRGFFEKALSGVAESLPGMLAPGGAIVRVGSLGSLAYSSIEDEMLADKDFETTSALDRSVVALPYAIGMGILENLGVSAAMSKNPLAKSLLTKSLLSAVKKVGGDASKEVIENVINKEIKSNIAKYGIRIVGGALAEAETGALQSAVLDIGLKKLYNSWKDANDGKTAEKLTEGEYFSTPDTFMGGLSQVAEDAAAEAIGGWAMTTVGTSAQAIMNKGQISLYNDKDVEFLKGLSTDPEVKKMFIAKLKTNMLQGSMTKSEAQEQLNSLNNLESTFSKIPDNITGENLKKSVGLISERNKLTQEIEGKDESLTAVQQARISEINNELKTISENAAKESNIEEVTAEGGGVQYQGTQEGQPEVGQGEGAVGQATQPETDLGNRLIEGRSIKEIGDEATQEVNTYIAELGSKERIGKDVDNVISKMNNAEYINDSEINSTIDTIFNEVESINNNSDYSDQTKKALSEKLMNIAEQLDNYEFRTKTETIAFAQRGTTPSVTESPTAKVEAEKFFDGQKAEVNGSPATFTSKNGRTEAVMGNGEVIVLDTPTMKINEGDFEFDDAGSLTAVTVTDRFGTTAKFTGDIAMDLAIKQRENEIGTVEQAEFDTVYKEVETKYIKQKSPTTEVTSKEKKGPEAVVQEEEAPDIIPTEPTAVEESVVNVEETAKALDGVKFNADFNLPLEQSQNSTQVAEAYIKAKQDGSNPELVKAVENIIGKQAVVEQPVVEEAAVTEEVDRLGKLLEGTDEQIDEQIGKLKISKDNSKVAQSIANAAKSIAKIFPDVKFVVHDNDKSYRKATNEQGRSQSSSGEYNPKTKTININASKANNRTAAHEVFHAILLNKIGSDIEAQRLTKAMINSVMKSLVQVKGSPKVISYLNDFASNYEKNIQNEEKLAELFGILADNYAKLPADTKNIIQRFIDRVRKILGLKPMTDREVIDFMNTISQKVATGQEITQKDISFLGNGTIDVTTSRKSKFIDSLVFERFPTNKNTKVIEDFKLSDINGQVAASTLSDKLTAGKLKKVKTVKGQETVDAEYIFYGGVGYPEVTGYVWAASTKDGVQKIIDSMVVSSDGYRYLIPAIMSNTSHMSNRNMTLITMEIFKEAIANNELNRTKFKELVSKAFSNKKAEKFKDGALNAISGNISGNQMCDNLKNYMLSSKMSFESRKDVLKSMVGNPESGNPKFSTVGTYLSLATSLSEPMVKDADMHQVAVVIRTKGNLTPKETDTNDVFYHDSYGFHIESDQEIEVLHLDGIYNLVDVIPEFTTDQGRTVSTKEELKEKGKKGWDIKRILTNLGRTHGLSKYSAEIVSPRKQLIGENANLAQNVRDNLQVARDMENAGKSVKDIRISTGWERGADKKWRYEVLDGTLKIEVGNFEGNLEEILENKELFDAYPDIAKLEVNLSLNGLDNAYYNISKKNIKVNGSKGTTLSLLLHEVQHAIQEIEGFEIGSNQLSVDFDLGLELTMLKDDLKRLEKSFNVIEKNKKEFSDNYYNEKKKEVDDLKNEINKLEEIIYDETLSPFEKYKRVSGEVEARNVQSRMKMTPQQRRETTLQETEDVSREDQIIFFKGQEESIASAVRKQKADTISKMVSIAKDNNFSDAAIRQYLKNQGYSDKESTAAINEYNVKKEGIFVAKDGGVPTKISNSIKSFKKKFFSARAFLPKSVFGYKENKEADIARNLNVVDLNVKDFNRLYSKYKGTKAEKDKIVENFDAYVRGDKNIKLPKEFLSVADSMRNQIDNLSRQLIDNGLVDADMAQTIKDNMGQYLTRSYKIYDRANWKKEVEEEVKQKARNFLRSQYRSMAEELAAKEDIPVDEVLDNIVDNKMDEMLTTEGASNFITGSKLGAKDLSVLKERQDIPFEIRALMGEYSDPALNYAKTVLKLSSLAANHKFLTEVKNAGMGVYLFEKNDPRRPKDFNTMIAAEGSKGMNPLNGLYTTKEIASQFEAQSNQLGEFMKLFMKFQSSIRWAKTIGSVATHMKNIIGNLGFVWTNGHFEPAAIAKAYSTVKNDFSKNNKQDLRDRMNNYISLGIVKQSAGLGEIKDMFKDADWDTAMASRLSNERLGILGKAKRFFLQKKKALEDAYQAEDDFFKIIAYENELSRYSEAMFNKNKNNLTEEELKEVNKVVTEIVKNTYPTYDRIPEAIKMIRRAPFIGNFVSFQAEAYRTAWNTMILAKNELASNNPKIKSIGAKRLTGATTYISAKTAALQYFSMAAGAGLTGVLGYLFDNDDEEKRDKDIREFVAPWSKESDLIVLEVGNGKLQYIDFSASDPHGGIKKVMNSFLQGESTIDSFIDGAFAAVSPFIGEEMATESLLELKNNQDKYGKQIWNPEEDLSEQSKNILGHLYKLIEPGTFSSIRRGVSAENKGRELVANITGFRVYDVDVNEQFGFKMRDYSERIKNAKKIYNSSFYNEEATADEKEKAYKNANKAVKGIYEDIIKIYNSAERLGVKPESLYSTMSDFGGIAKYKIEEIQSGKIEDLKRKEEE